MGDNTEGNFVQAFTLHAHEGESLSEPTLLAVFNRQHRGGQDEEHLARPHVEESSMSLLLSFLTYRTCPFDNCSFYDEGDDKVIPGSVVSDFGDLAQFLLTPSSFLLACLLSTAWLQVIPDYGVVSGLPGFPIGSA